MYVYCNSFNTLLLVGFLLMICHEVHKTFGAVINMDKQSSFLSFWKDSMMYVEFVLHASCVAEKVGINPKWHSDK